MKKALINIDYTVDFVADNGALTCGKQGQEIETALTELTNQFIDNGDYVVFAIDTHRENDEFHPETKLYPPHNISGKPGRELYGLLNETYQRHKAKKHVYWMDKTRYSAFAGTDLELKLRERGITEIHLAGVCTDICILHTAADAYNKGFSITVHQNAVASFNQTGHDWALQHFIHSLGAAVV
nr:isochorismatase family cysteine hydrolase [uncultured Bacillus sp.]